MKKRKEEVKQAPEKPTKALEIMEKNSKSLQSTPSSDDLFGMMVTAEIKIHPLRRRGKSNLKSTISFSNIKKMVMLQVPKPPPIQTFDNTNTNLPSISLNEP